MAEVKTSPGPWKAVWFGERSADIVDANGDSILIAVRACNVRLIASAPALAAQLAEAVGLLRRAREHIADLQPLQGACEHPDCSHRYCADLKATNAESVAIVAAIDALAKG